MFQFSRSRSAPALSSLGFQHCVMAAESAELEVYVASRIFREHGGALTKTLSEDFREYARICGICHFFVVFKTHDGKMFQFDFGPSGGDIHVPSNNPFSFIFPKKQLNQRQDTNQNPSKDHNEKDGEVVVPGEIRENMVDELPKDHLHVGSTTLTIDDIRKFNSNQSTHYELHKNDCRHYANNLTKYATGVDRISSRYVRQQFRSIRASLSVWNSSFIWIMQGLSDLSHWPKVKTASNATAAALFALVGPPLARGAGLPTQMRSRPMPRAAVAALASAAASCRIPVLRDVIGIGNKINRGAQNFFAGIGSLFRATRKVPTSYLTRGPLHFMAANSLSRRPTTQRTTFSFLRRASTNSLSFLTAVLHRPLAHQLNSNSAPIASLSTATTSMSAGVIGSTRMWRPFRSWPRSRRRFRISLPYTM